MNFISNFFVNVRGIDLRVILKLAFVFTKAGFSKSEPIGTVKTVPKGQETTTVLEQWKSLLEKETAVHFDGKILDKEGLLTRMKSLCKSTPRQGITGVTGCHRNMAAFFLAATGTPVHISTVDYGTVSADGGEQLKENAGKLILNRISAKDILDQVKNKPVSEVTRSWLVKHGVTDGTAQKIEEQRRLLEAGLEYKTVLCFDKEKARALRKELETIAPEAKEKTIKKHVELLGSNQGKGMLNRKDIEGLLAKAEKAGKEITLLKAILDKSVAQAEIALGV